MSVLAVVVLALFSTIAPLIAPQPDGSVGLWPLAEAIRDDPRALTVETVGAPDVDWRPADEVTRDHGSTRLQPAVVWFRFRIAPAVPSRYSVLVSWHALDAVLYVPRDGGGFDVLRTGHVPVAQKLRREAQNVIPLPPAALDGRTLYLRTTSPFTHDSVLRVEGEESPAARRQLEDAGLDGFLLALAGFVFAFAALNTVTAVRLRRRTSAYYAVAAGTASLQVLVLTGDAWKWLWPGLSIDYDLAFYLTYGTTIAFAAVFGRAFLDVRRRLPLVDRFTLAGLAVFLIANAAYLFVPEWLVGAGLYDITEMVATAAVMAPLILAGALRLRDGDREALLYLIAAASVLSGTLLGEAGRELPIAQTTLVRLAPAFGFALEALLLSIALADRAQSYERGALQDGLTGLANRRAFDERLTAERARSVRTRTPFAVLMLGVDRFTVYNDRYGHAAGDAVLRRIGAALAAEIRGIDCAARYGGEEFVALLVTSDAGSAAVVAERVCAAVRALHVEHAGTPSRVVTVSIGVAQWRTDGSDAVLRAEAALSASKAGGGDRVTLEPPSAATVTAFLSR